jgi:hypothetical protein
MSRLGKLCEDLRNDVKKKVLPKISRKTLTMRSHVIRSVDGSVSLKKKRKKLPESKLN